MKIIILIFLLCISSSIARDNEVQNFDWISGEWSAKTDNGIFYERWEKIDSLNYKGIEFQVYKSDTLFKANLVIQKIDKYWVYIAQVNNNNPTLFTLVSNNEHYTFENKEHDFPQRISYQIKNDNKIKAIVEGIVKGELYKEEFDLIKKK